MRAGWKSICRRILEDTVEYEGKCEHLSDARPSLLDQRLTFGLPNIGDPPEIGRSTSLGILGAIQIAEDRCNTWLQDQPQVQGTVETAE